jgi:isopenicillin N synthase-like dioxygenase
VVVSNEIIEQLQVSGYARLRLPPAVWDSLADVLPVALRFFHKPLNEKLRIAFRDHCGFREMGVEYSKSPERPDQIESFSVSGRMLGSRSTADGSTAAQILCERMLVSFHDLELIVEELAVTLATSLAGSLVASSIRGSIRHWSRFQLNYSKPAEVPIDLIHDAHEDGSFITLAGATAPGLELVAVAGGFEPATTDPGELLVLPGEIASLLSGGIVRPMFHRVRPDPQCAERLAYLFFADIDPWKCSPWINSAINKGVDIGARVRTNVNRFGLKGFGSDVE